MSSKLPMLLALPVLLACTATETGNPSADPIRIEGMRLSGNVRESDPVGPASTQDIMIQGGPGAVDPAEGVVLAWNLANDDRTAMAGIGADGSFVLLFPGLPGDPVRIEVRHSDRRSVPFDVRVDNVNGITVVEPANPCLLIEPTPIAPLGSAEGSTVAVRLNNDCGDTVTRSRAFLRTGATGVSLMDDGSTSLVPGSSVELQVARTAGTEPPDGILLIEILEPVLEVRAVSIWP